MALDKDSLGFLLADVSRLMRRAFRQQLDGSALTHAQARALVYVARNEGVRQIELADLLDIQPITLARLLDQLADAGLVERRPDPADRRAYLIFLQAAATPHLAAIKQVAQRITADAMRGTDKQDAVLIVETLSRMRANLSAQ
jgi:DNA-binding MarR family transcriptional regulator